MNEPKLNVQRVPVLDTWIGRQLGYADDKEFVAAASAEREAALSALTPEAREMIEKAERDLERRVLGA